MNKLTQQEANLVIGEAYRLMGEQIAKFGMKHARLGQAIHWTADINISMLPVKLALSLAVLLDSDCGTEYDFYHFTDTDKVLEVFYQRYVGE